MKGMKVNMVYGFIATIGTAIFGDYWFLFLGFLVTNIVDYFTGLAKSKRLKKESSAVGAWGAFKKVCYWVVIALAFFISRCFIGLGNVVGIDLAFVQFFGWFTLASYLVNEIRSILENLVEMDVNVPAFLIKGLAVTEKLLNAKTKTEEEQEEN